MKRAILYARVSTDDQADKGYSLPSQITACRLYAERQGFSVAGEYLEDYSGATAIADRPEGKKVVADLKARKADVLIVYQVDRLSRDIVDLLASVRGWLRAGLEVHTCDIGKIESELDIVLVIKGWQGSDERKKIIERTTRGRRAKAEAGKVVGNGRPLYGYVYVKDNRENARRIGFEIYEPEAKVVRLIYKMYCDNKPHSLFAIARHLTEIGIPIPSASNGRTNPQHKRARGDTIWSVSTVRLILKSESYAGVWRFGKKRGMNGNGGTRSIDEQIAVTIPAIVDHAQWEIAQERLVLNHKHSPRNTKHRDYILGGRVRCGCDGIMFGQRVKGVSTSWYYYRCMKPRNRYAGIEATCHEKSIPAEALEDLVWRYVVALVEQQEEFAAALQEAQAEELKALDAVSDQLEIILEQVKETERESFEVSDALRRAPRGGIIERNLLADADRVERLYQEQIAKRDELQAVMNKRNFSQERIEAALRFAEDVKIGIANASDQDKRQWFQFLEVSVVIKDGNATITCILPVQPYVIDINASKSANHNYTNFMRFVSKPIALTQILGKRFSHPKRAPTAQLVAA